MSLEQFVRTVSRELDQLKEQVDRIGRNLQHFYIHAGPQRTHTIASGLITATRPNVYVEPESGITDNLDAINGFADGKIVIVAPANSGDEITVMDYRNLAPGVGNIDLHGNNWVLTDPNNSVYLYYSEATTKWHPIAIPTIDDLRKVNIVGGVPGDVLTLQVDGYWANETPVTGVTDFLSLTDTPDDYVGFAGYHVVVNGTEDALEFVAGSGGAVDSVNGQTGVVVLDTDDIAEGTTNLYWDEDLAIAYAVALG